MKHTNINHYIRTNLLRLKELVQNQPITNLNLNSYRSETNCGTCFCVLGLAASDTYFNEQGIEFNKQNRVLINGEWFRHTTKTDNLFGKDAHSILFEGYNFGGKDKDLNSNKLTHKALALTRIDYQLAQYQAS